MEQRDYIIDQIENIAQFIAKIITNVKIEDVDQTKLDQTLSALTGIDSSFLINGDTRLLNAVLPLLEDNNAKAIVARILQLKNPKIYGEIYEYLMAGIEIGTLSPKVRELFNEMD